MTADHHGAGLRSHHSRYAMQQRGLPARVRSEKRQPLAARDRKVHVHQYCVLFVARIQVLNRQGGRFNAHLDLMANQHATATVTHDESKHPTVSVSPKRNAP